MAIPNHLATMKDVAAYVGVSTATVSRALMKPEKVASMTRQKVEQAALALGYPLQTFVRHGKRGASRTILVIVPDICAPFFNEIIKGIEYTAAQQGYFVLLSDCAHQTQQQHLLELIAARQVEGILLLGSQIPFRVDQEGQRNLPPLVMVNEFAPALNIPTVHIDNLTAAFEAVFFLHSLGHRRIACITGPSHVLPCQYRLKGYIQALRRAGLEENLHYIVNGDFSYESGVSALNLLMSQPIPPTAIFCHNDTMAIGALSQAKRLGLRVPQDLSLIGFDNIAQTAYTDPPLTTVAQPRFELGSEAMLLLLDKLNNHNTISGSRLLNSEFLIRSTTSAPNMNLNMRDKY